MNCPLHDVEMFEGKFGPVHKTDDPKFPKGWCNGKEKTDYKGTWERRKTDFVGSLSSSDIDPKERSRRIERQHSQEMALRYMTLLFQTKEGIRYDQKRLKIYIDWFAKDLD